MEGDQQQAVDGSLNVGPAPENPDTSGRSDPKGTECGEAASSDAPVETGMAGIPAGEENGASDRVEGDDEPEPKNRVQTSVEPASSSVEMAQADARETDVGSAVGSFDGPEPCQESTETAGTSQNLAKASEETSETTSPTLEGADENSCDDQTKKEETTQLDEKETVDEVAAKPVSKDEADSKDDVEVSAPSDSPKGTGDPMQSNDEFDSKKAPDGEASTTGKAEAEEKEEQDTVASDTETSGTEKDNVVITDTGEEAKDIQDEDKQEANGTQLKEAMPGDSCRDSDTKVTRNEEEVRVDDESSDKDKSVMMSPVSPDDESEKAASAEMKGEYNEKAENEKTGEDTPKRRENPFLKMASPAPSKDTKDEASTTDKGGAGGEKDANEASDKKEGGGGDGKADNGEGKTDENSQADGEGAPKTKARRVIRKKPAVKQEDDLLLLKMAPLDELSEPVARSAPSKPAIFLEKFGTSYGMDFFTLLNNAVRRELSDLYDLLWALDKFGEDVGWKDLMMFFEWWKVFEAFTREAFQLSEKFTYPLLTTAVSPEGLAANTTRMRQKEYVVRGLGDVTRSIGKHAKSQARPFLFRMFGLVDRFAPTMLAFFAHEEKNLPKLIEEHCTEKDKEKIDYHLVMHISKSRSPDMTFSIILRWMNPEQRAYWRKKVLPKSIDMHLSGWASTFEREHLEVMNGLLKRAQMPTENGHFGALSPRGAPVQAKRRGWFRRR